jgi:hypothetical protein
VKKLDTFGIIMLLIGNLLLIISTCVLLSLDFQLELFHILALVIGVSGVITTLLSYIIALVVGTDKSVEYEEYEE